MYHKSVINNKTSKRSRYNYEGNVTQETMIVTVSKRNKTYKKAQLTQRERATAVHV